MVSRYDILITCKVEDRNKLPFLLNSIEKNLTEYGDIFVICNERLQVPGVINLTDDQVIPLKYKESLTYRPGWIFQQYIKLFQQVTEHDHYLVIDADVFINRPLRLFDGSKPKFFFGSNGQHHLPYFKFMSECGIKDTGHYTYIHEIMMFQKSLIDKFLSNRFCDRFAFMEQSNKIMSPECHLSEFELYGNWIDQQYPLLYSDEQIITRAFAQSRAYTNDEILAIINSPEISPYHLIAYHSWLH